MTAERDCRRLARGSPDLDRATCERCQGTTCGTDDECDLMFPCIEEEIVIHGCCDDQDCDGIAPFCGQYRGVDEVCVVSDDI